MNYCKDCKHFKTENEAWRTSQENMRYGKCAIAVKNPGDILIDPELAQYHYAAVIRQSKVEGDCGEVGLNFEAKGEK